jgi:ATP/maltotriose-dependent transcriptional regulator MalT
VSIREGKMEERLDELRSEYQRGLRELALLDQRRDELHRTLLRISGAIQVLEELLEQAQQSNADPPIASASPAIQVVGA